MRYAVRRKDELAVDKILECAKSEFMEKGFLDASMRSIAEKAGYTTGMLYGRFADKTQLFKEIVEKPASRLFDYFTSAESAFFDTSPQNQYKNMHVFVEEKVKGIIDIIYDDFDAFKLIVCKSAGSGYEYYVEKMVNLGTENTLRYVECLKQNGIAVNDVRADLTHMLTSALFNGVLEIVWHDFPKEDALQYATEVQNFFIAGWDNLFGFKK